MNEATKKLHQYAHIELERLDEREDLERAPGRYQRQRNRCLAILEVDLERRSPLVIRCDLQPDCRKTIARVYSTSMGPLWVPTKDREAKNDVAATEVQLLTSSMLSPRLPTCRIGHDWPAAYYVGPAMLEKEYQSTQAPMPKRVTLNATEFALPLRDASKA